MMILIAWTSIATETDPEAETEEDIQNRKPVRSIHTILTAVRKALEAASTVQMIGKGGDHHRNYLDTGLKIAIKNIEEVRRRAPELAMQNRRLDMVREYDIGVQGQLLFGKAYEKLANVEITMTKGLF